MDGQDEAWRKGCRVCQGSRVLVFSKAVARAGSSGIGISPLEWGHRPGEVAQTPPPVLLPGSANRRRFAHRPTANLISGIRAVGDPVTSLGCFDADV